MPMAHFSHIEKIIFIENDKFRKLYPAGLAAGPVISVGVAVSTLPASCFCSKKSVKIVSKKSFVFDCLSVIYTLIPTPKKTV